MLLWFLLSVTLTTGDLVVNVRNQGGESYKQEIRANLTDETVTLEFASHDGSTTTMVIDFRNEIQLVHTIRLGDQEENEIDSLMIVRGGAGALPPHNQLYDDNKNVEVVAGGAARSRSHHHHANSRKSTTTGESSQAANHLTTPSLYRSYCFVTKFKQHEFIPVDAMAKLRQKNPSSLRTPERSEPPQNITFDILLDPTASDWLSPTIRQHCVSDPQGNFVTSTYAIKMEVGERAGNAEDYLRAVRDIVVEDEKPCTGGSGPGVDRGAGGDDDGVVVGVNQNSPVAAAGVGTGINNNNNNNWSPACVCTTTVCIGWYPCALKFCRARTNSAAGGAVPANMSTINDRSNAGGMLPQSGASSTGPGAAAAAGADGGSNTNSFKTYRCGIHTCRVCRNYSFGVRNPGECV